jgi:mono/diheme cytochrome c family protein
MNRRARTWFTVSALIVTTAVIDGTGAGNSATGPRARQPPATVPSGARAIVDRYCASCHNDTDHKGDLTLETMNIDRVDEDIVAWEKVVRKLRVRAMPPLDSDKPRPDEAGYDALVSYLERALDRASARTPNPGRPQTFHRLNRIEYQNAIRDLLALEVDAASLLPADDASRGFDNVNVGELSPTHLERYVSAARKVSRLALGSPVRAADAHTVVLPLDLTQDDRIDEALPAGTRGGTSFRHVFPQDGDYTFQIRLTRDRDDKVEGLGEPLQIELALDGAPLRVFALTPPIKAEGTPAAAYVAADGEPDAALKDRFPVKAGPHTVTAAFLKRTSAVAEVARQPFLADYNGRNMAAIFSVSVAGPYNPRGAGDTTSRRRILACRPARPADESGCAATILSALARRAYRRPVTAGEVQDLLGFYEQGRRDGADFEAGLETALRALLVSPNFLFRIERDPADIPPRTPYRLTDLELASRLSFFLWSSIPDDELLAAAGRGALAQPAVLTRQVRRMLADPRSDALVNNFAGQWLQVRNLAASMPNPRLFPDFDDNLRRAFRRETELFVDSVKKEDRSVLDLLRADYTFLNERLARHYGVPNVYGAQFRRVTLPADNPRRGLLGHASVLTVTSYADRTSPVQRGKWILENFLGMSPPPPPAVVPPLKERGTGDAILTMRQRMAQHRDNPACAGCHALMDPIGLSTENFDAIGRWRTREGSARIDASGGLPDGSTFDGIAGLRSALLRRPELFVSTMTEKLLTYALGRGVGAYDAPAIRGITRAAAADDYRFSSLVLGVVRSAPFQMRRSQ